MDIYIYSQVGAGGVTAQGMAYALANANGEDVTLRINSPGGSIFEGIAIYNLLNSYAGKVTAIVDGCAASVASVIAMGAREIVMNAGSLMFLHMPLKVETSGNAEQLRKDADDLDKFEAAALEIYTKRTGMTADQVRELMKAETFICAADAVRMKFADRMALDAETTSKDANMSIVQSFRNAVPVAEMFKAAGFEFTAEGAKAVLEAAKAGKPNVDAAVLSRAFDACGIQVADVVADEHCIAKAIAAAREDGEAKMSAELSRVTGELDALSKMHALLTESAKAHAALTSKLGLEPSATAEQINAAFDAYTSKHAAAVLSSQGVPAPIHDAVNDDSKPAVAMSDAEIFTAYKAIKSDAERVKFYQANSEAIWRARSA